MMSATKTTSAPKEKKLNHSRVSSFQLKPGERLLKDAGPKVKGVSKGMGKPQKKKETVTLATSKKAEKPKYNKDATQKFDDMIDGDLTDLPPPPKTMVKIFLSSTFSDMRAERNTLVCEVYPELRDYCTSCGLDFQVVDMRWGVTDDSSNDHSVEQLCLLEVANCQKVSVGPNFIAISGDRYGFRPIPVELNVNMFEVLRSEAEKHSLNGRALIDEWYKLDTNAVPNMYILQPIRSKFTFFADYSPGCEEPRQRDTAEWWKTFEALQSILRQAAETAFKVGSISEEERHQFFLSVTECEIQEGILKANNVNKHCLVYKRHLNEFEGLGLQLKDAPRFIDVVKTEKGNVVDKEVAGLRESLFKEKIKRKLSQSNIKEYDVYWKPGGINPEENPEDRTYMEQFCKDFIHDCINLIDKAREESENLIMMSNYYTDYDETIHHLKFCLSKCESFCGQEKVLEEAKAYICDQSGRKPLVIHAESGLGKTSIMAMIMKSIPKWLDNKSHVKLIRFLGTTPQCMNIYDVLFSVLGQLSDSYDMIMSPVNYRNMKKLVEFTPRYLRQIATTAKEPIIVLLDSVDQLAPYNNAYSMEWLPTLLPTNLKLIISTLPEEHGILDNLKKILPDKECYVEVPLLSQTTGKLIAETYLKLKKRSLTPKQTDLLLSVFRESPSALFLKLLLDEARKWNSYTPVGELELAPTVKEAINKLFSNLETKFGITLVSHALGYITIGYSGLTEFEIEDVLSCDDEVLIEVYRYHDPPVPGIVRIPPLLWARIRHDIREYLVEKLSQGKSTLYWYHRQFIETARQRYTQNGEEKLHRNLVDIYLQENGFKRTIKLQHRRDLSIPDADRQVTPQPFKASNRRKLACLPYHTLRSRNVLDKNIALKNIYCNFNFLCTKICAYSVAGVVSDLTEFVEATDDPEAKLLLSFLLVSKDELTVPLRFAVCLLAYIYPEGDHYHLTGLQNEARRYIELKNKPVLVPDFPCLAPRVDASSAFQSSHQGYTDVLASSNTTLFLQKKCSKENEKVEKPTTFAVWSSDTQEIVDVEFKEENVTQFILNETFVFFATKEALVRYEISKAKCDTFPLAKLAPEKSGKIQALISDADKTVAAFVFKSKITIVDLESLKLVQNFSVSNESAEIENAVVLNSGSKVIAVGRIVNSLPNDIPQGPENQCFICVFEEEKDEPVQFVEMSQELDFERTAMVCKDEWFVVATKMEPLNETEKELTDSDKAKSVQLLMYNIVHGNSTQRNVEIPEAVTKIHGNPNKTQLAVLAKNGTVYIVKFTESSTKTDVLTLVLNFPINEFIIDWEKDTAFLCSSGKVTMYKLMSDKNLGAFTAHAMDIQEILLLEQQCVTLSVNYELKIWSISTLFKDLAEQNIVVDHQMSESLLSEQMNITALKPSGDGDELISCHDSGIVKIWSIESHNFLRKYDINMLATMVHILTGNIGVFHDTTQGQIKILELESWEEAIKLPDTIENILHSTVSPDGNDLYLISAPKKGKEQIDVVNVSLRKVTKTIHLQSGLIYEEIEVYLSVNKRYIVLRHKIPESEFERIKAMWKKGGFGEQDHRYRFTAVDLSQGNGALIPCFRQQSKIPTLGVFVHPYKGNVVLISTRRWLVFWDIPTGKCDQKLSKGSKDGMFYRPTWLGQSSTGANTVFMRSANQKYLACGSEDGYVFIYNFETGLPAEKRKPSTKHNAEVHCLAVSPNSKWVASACRNSVLKLWDTASGVEQFSVRLDAAVQCLTFTSNSEKLVLFTGTSTTRVLMFYISVCKKKETS